MIAAPRRLEHAATTTAVSAFAEVYQRHAPTVYRFCLSQLGDAHHAEDAAADVFTIAFAAYERVDPDEGVLFWLLGIARRVVSGQRRRGHRRHRLDERMRRAAPAGQDVHEVVAVRDDLRRVVDALRDMGRRDRLLIGLRLAAQLSHAEIGELLGMSEGSVRVANHRALRSLRARLEGGR